MLNQHVLKGVKILLRLFAIMYANMRCPQARSLFAIGGLCFIWIWLHTRIYQYSLASPRRFSYLHSLKAKPIISAAQNRTMGFGAILMAILPDRTDQVDTASLLSSYLDIDITIIEGVATVLKKTRPPGGARLKRGQIGCWRAHMNMMRYVVDHRLETALILEADVDWDVRIKDQLEELGKHIPGASKTRPYGTFLHYADQENLGPVIRYHDKTVGTLDSSGCSKMEGSWVAGDLQAYQAQNNQRIIHRAYCYMVTLEGARRILYQLGLNQQTAAIDLNFLEAHHRRELNGLIVVPPLMQQWKTGDAAKNSDIEEPNPAEVVVGSGPCIVQSMRASLHDRAFNKSRVDWIDRTDLTR